jgi:hypothetical protein
MSREKTVMPRIAPVEPRSASGGVERAFDAVAAHRPKRGARG